MILLIQAIHWPTQGSIMYSVVISHSVPLTLKTLRMDTCMVPYSHQHKLFPLFRSYINL